MTRIVVFSFFCGTVGLVSGASLDKIKIDFVFVGDPNNPENTKPKAGDGSTGYGSVPYSYRIGKYEVTNDQYVSFLNSVASVSDTYDLYHPNMAAEIPGGIVRSGIAGNYSYSTKLHMGNKPVNFVSFFDGARFANWLQNGQPHGLQDSTTTETGAYTLSAINVIGGRSASAKYYLPDEHEWQKAAYYEPGANTQLTRDGFGDGWWFRPGATDDKPISATVDAFGNVTNPGYNVVNRNQAANWNGSNPSEGNVVTVGSAGSESYYGAFDMVGNVWEWTLADPTKPDPNGWGPRIVQGGSFTSIGHWAITDRNLVHHANHNRVNKYTGIRLAAAVPEPSSFAFGSIATLLVVASRRRASTRQSRRQQSGKL